MHFLILNLASLHVELPVQIFLFRCLPPNPLHPAAAESLRRSDVRIVRKVGEVGEIPCASIDSHDSFTHEEQWRHALFVVSVLSERITDNCRIDSIICLSTGFTYLSHFTLRVTRTTLCPTMARRRRIGGLLAATAASLAYHR